MYDTGHDLETDQNDLIALVRQMGVDERDRHIDKMRDILSDDLLFRRANGRIVTNKQYLQKSANRVVARPA